MADQVPKRVCRDYTVKVDGDFERMVLDGTKFPEYAIHRSLEELARHSQHGKRKLTVMDMLRRYWKIFLDWIWRGGRGGGSTKKHFFHLDSPPCAEETTDRTFFL